MPISIDWNNISNCKAAEEGMPEIFLKAKYSRFKTTRGVTINRTWMLRFALGMASARINTSQITNPDAE